MAHDVDEVIVRFMRSWSEETERELLETGVAGLDRMLEHDAGTEDPIPPDRFAAMHPRDAMDRWRQGLHLLAVAHPDRYITWLRSHHRSWQHQRMEAALILRAIGDPATADLLCAWLADDDWLVRLHTTRALVRLAELEPQPCVEPVLRDRVAMVRHEAVRALSHWDRDRAIAELEALVRPKRLSRSVRHPSVQAAALVDLDRLRQGLSVADQML